MLTLEEFITETLSQIAKATARATNTIEGQETAGLPRSVEIARREDFVASGLLATHREPYKNVEILVRYSTIVDFDVAVTAQDTETAKVGGGIRVMQAFRAEASAEAANLNSSVSRIRFKIPLRLT